jgi:hypothetical protein
MNLISLEKDFPFVLDEKAGGSGVGVENLQQSGLPGPVLPHKSYNFTGIDLKVDALESKDTRETLGYVDHSKERGCPLSPDHSLFFCKHGFSRLPLRKGFA